jgi:hypothetical protein
MASHDTQDSPLLRLPAELRNHIWDYVLTLQRPIGVHRLMTLSSYDDPDKDICFEIPNKADMEAHGDFAPLFHLSQVCRDLRAETSGLVYSANVFAVEVADLEEFLHQLHANARLAIKALALRTNRQHDKDSHVLERRFCRLRRNLGALAQLPSLEKIFLPNYGTPGASVEDWEEAVLSSAGARVEVKMVEERIVEVETPAGVEEVLKKKYW